MEDPENGLRKRVVQAEIDQVDETGYTYNTVCPGWFNKEADADSIDIGEMLNRDEQPVNEVLAAIKRLNEKEIL